MITLDQIKQLDFKVRKAIDKINSLKSANEILQEKLDSYQIRIEELEVLIDTYKEDQGAIEHGIIEALNKLDILEDNVENPNKDVEQTETPPVSEESDQELSESEEENKIESSTEPQEETTQIISDGDTEEERKEEISTDSEIELDIF